MQRRPRLVLATILVVGLLGTPGLSSAGEIAPPAGWFEHARAKGDLNRDGLEDTVVAFTNCEGREGCQRLPGAQRKVELRVYLGGKTGSTLLTSSPKALCMECGGMSGGFITGYLEITKKGILEIRYEGGSREMWSHLFKWRLGADQKLALIGKTGSAYDRLSEDGSLSGKGDVLTTDINYSTRKFEAVIRSKAGKKIRKSCRLAKDFELPAFERFDYEKFDDGTGVRASDCTATP